MLVAAVMLQESGGQPDVISASGAVGLMQVMPSDGIAAGFMCVNGPCFASRPTIEMLLDPAFNIDYGVRMLAGLIEKYGSERDALKAYGPYNVEYYYADKVLTIRDNLDT
jgi:soluble lytic murein transglycosylase-like protein